MSCFALPMLHRYGCRSILGAAALLLSVAACGGSSDDEPSVTVVSTGPNVVSYWNDIANKTVNATGAVATTPEEQRPSYQVDLATVHVAIYDAVSAIDGRFTPFAVTPTAPAAGASIDAAASAAAWGVLRALFPNRGAQYEAAYQSYVAAIPTGDAKAKGLALGSEVAAAVVALRANDGRNVVLAPYVSGTAPGKFRSPSPTPFNRFVPFIKPFALTRADQFRPAGPPPLASTAYATDLNQTKAVGGTVSTERTAAQLETARFHTEAPGLFVTRNLGRFATSTTDVAEAARLMALIYVVHADTITACFEAKYFYETWRPLNAIPLADTDDNPATTRRPRATRPGSRCSRRRRTPSTRPRIRVPRADSARRCGATSAPTRSATASTAPSRGRRVTTQAPTRSAKKAKSRTSTVACTSASRPSTGSRSASRSGSGSRSGTSAGARDRPWFLNPHRDPP